MSGKVFAGIAQQIAARSQPVSAPCVLLSGGETTVTVRGDGSGGRNVEFLLSLGVALNWRIRASMPSPGIPMASTAPRTSPEPTWRPSSLERARAQGILPRASLERNDGHGFFKALGDSVITGAYLYQRGTTFARCCS